MSFFSNWFKPKTKTTPNIEEIPYIANRNGYIPGTPNTDDSNVKTSDGLIPDSSIELNPGLEYSAYHEGDALNTIGLYKYVGSKTYITKPDFTKMYIKKKKNLLMLRKKEQK
jgi:hypothetical protein